MKTMKAMNILSVAMIAILSIGTGIAYAEDWAMNFASTPDECIGTVITPAGYVYDPPGDACIITLEILNDKIYTAAFGGTNGHQQLRTYDARLTYNQIASTSTMLNITPIPTPIQYQETNITSMPTPVPTPIPTPQPTPPPVSTYNPITDVYPLPTVTPQPNSIDNKGCFDDAVSTGFCAGKEATKVIIGFVAGVGKVISDIIG